MWVYIPSTSAASPCAREEGASNWGSDLHLETATAASLTSKGKLMPLASLQRVWRKGGWIRHLAGLTLSPSTADAIVGEYLSLQPATRASHFLARDDSEEPTTQGTCGPTSPASSASANPSSSSWRTSPTTSTLDFLKSPESYKRWASALRQDCSRRKRSALHTEDSDSSSWRTPDAADPNRGAMDPLKRANANHQVFLKDQAVFWASPTSRDWKGGAESRIETMRLDTQAEIEFPSSRPDPETSTPGQPSLSNAPTSPLRLNPAFVEWLMGWPEGWTDAGAPVASHSYHFWETASCHSLQHLLSAFSPDGYLLSSAHGQMTLDLRY